MDAFACEPCQELAGITVRAASMVEFAGEDASSMQKLLDVIEALDEVQAVHHNAVLPS